MNFFESPPINTPSQTATRVQQDWADLYITMAVDCSVGQRPVGALGLTWTDCPGQRANTEEKRFMDGACGQVIASPSL